jgi:hypothetical protein
VAVSWFRWCAYPAYPRSHRVLGACHEPGNLALSNGRNGTTWVTIRADSARVWLFAPLCTERPFIVHVCTKWTSSSPSPRVADHRISYEGDLQSLGEIETGDHRTSPGSCGCGLMSVLNSGSPYNNCWFLLALSGQHGPGCPRRPRLPSTRVPLRAVGNGSTGIVERI